MSITHILKRIIPPLTTSLHKGQLGKICIIGGCREYTGAPFYAGISAQRAGADYVTIVCSEEAGIPIKCYSPELIVYPTIKLDDCDVFSTSFRDFCSANVNSIVSILARVDSLVIGPGAGRHPMMISTLSQIITHAVNQNIPLVIDGDGLWVVTLQPSLIQGAQNVILTPNQMEFSRLWNAVMNDSRKPGDLVSTEEHCYASQLSTKLGGVTIFQKGAVDVIVHDEERMTVDEQGCMRRCGGQGDVVAGTLGLFHLWSRRAHAKESLDIHPELAAAVATAKVIKQAAHRAFAKERRGMTALSISNQLAEVVDSYCDQ